MWRKKRSANFSDEFCEQSDGSWIRISGEFLFFRDRIFLLQFRWRKWGLLTYYILFIFFSLLHAFVTLLTSTTTNWMMKQGPLASLISSSCRAMSADSALREMIFFRGCYIWWKMQETHIFLCVASFLCRGYGWRREYCVGIRPWRAIEITPIFLLFFFSSPGQYLCSAFIQHDGERCHDLF